MKEELQGSRVLAVDWGSKRLGLAISDESGTIAQPLTVISHVSKSENAGKILEIAQQRGVGRIIVGITKNAENNLTPSGRSAMRLIEHIRAQGIIPVKAFDESNSTKKAKQSTIMSGVSKKKRRGHQDGIAAAIILQTYLEECGNVGEK